MDELRDVFLSSEPLLLFVVIGLGFLVGQIRIRGFKLGVAGVLFVGLAFGGWKPEGAPSFVIAPQIHQVGLILFVYAVGLTSGPGFFSSLKKSGLRFNLTVLLALLVGALTTFLLGGWMRLPSAQVAGVFCGALTNTPALAAITELSAKSGLGDPSDPAVGYSVAYPFGVIGGLLAFQVFAWLYQRAYRKEQEESERIGKMTRRPVIAHFVVRNPALFDKAIGELEIRDKTGLIISRYRHGNTVAVPTKYTVLHEGDVVLTVGSESDVEKGAAYFGDRSGENLEHSEAPIEMGRVLVSRKQLVGRTLESLDLDRKFNAQVTRVRRADIEMVARPDVALELGDRLRVVMPTDRVAEVAAFFGDSQRDISELDYTALTLGIAAGVLIGLIPVPIPGGARVALGFAGGPLIAGLILGRLGRTGPLVWSIPLEANQALRHIGLLFFLAGVGVMAGEKFFGALSSNGLSLFLLGLVTTSLTTLLTLFLLRHFARASIVSALGATSGMQTQPATLARAYEMSKSEETYIAYATTYPAAMVGKILIAQVLLLIGNAL